MQLIDVLTLAGPEGIRPRAGSIEFLYRLMQERMTEPEVNISATMPTFEEHEKFVRSHPYRLWQIIEDRGVWMGYVSATTRNEIGIVLCKAYRGKGYGPAAVRMMMEQNAPLPAQPSTRAAHWLANINPVNQRSREMFERMGFDLCQVTYRLQAVIDERVK